MKTKIFRDKRIEDKSQNGAALIIAIFAILLVTVIGFALVSTGMLSQNISKNSRQQTEAYYISEAGLTHGTKLLFAANPSEFTAILQAGDGIAYTGDELSTRPTALTPIPAAGIAFGKGRYFVYVSDDPADTDGNPNADSNDRIVVTSVGQGEDGATVTTESIIGVTTVPAILINGNAAIQGSTVLRGTMGSAHINGNLTLLDSPCADGSFTASGSITNASFAKTGAGCSNPGSTIPSREVIPLPSWNIRSDFYNRADYVLGAIGSKAGKVYNNSGTMIADTSLTANTWIMGAGQQWTWNSSGGTWIYSGLTMPSATYYSEANLDIDSDLGSSILPVKATFIAEGYVYIKKTAYLSAKLESYGVMAGTDLTFATKVISTPGTQSIFYARHQLDIAGSSDIRGVLIVANLADTNSPFCVCNPAKRAGAGEVKINSNMTLTYNGGLFENNPIVISWREVRY